MKNAKKLSGTIKDTLLNHSTEPIETSFFKFDPSHEKKYFPKSDSLPIRNNLMNFKEPGSLGYATIVKRNAQHLWSV